MEYRKFPHGKHGERFSVLGLGMGGIQNCPDAEIEQVIRTAVENGINFLTFAGEAGISISLSAELSRVSVRKCFFSFISGRFTMRWYNKVVTLNRK